MPDLENETDDKLRWRVRNDAGPVGNAARAVLTQRSVERSMQQLVDALDRSSDTQARLTKKLNDLTVWLVVLTVALVLVGLATLMVGVVTLVVTVTD
jgi:magnesium-transporting ATPase (P-type)